MINRFEKIGVLDSGLGAMSVVNELSRAKIAKEIIVYADSKRAPWGSRSSEELWGFVDAGVNFLVSKKIDALVLGCNTTDALFKDRLVEKYDMPVLGLIDPCIEFLLKQFGVRRLVLFATLQTVRSKAYFQAVQNHQANLDIVDYPIGELVAAIENNELHLNNKLIEEMVSVIKSQEPDAYILGCTHFPMAQSLLKNYVDVPAVDPAICLLSYLKSLVKSRYVENTVVSVYSSADPEKYKEQVAGYYPALDIACEFYDPFKIAVSANV